MAEISKITLPSGNTYDIKDATAREMISGGVSFVIAWDGSSAPTIANIPAGVKIKYNDVEYTGTLAADDAQTGAFYLVKSSTTPSSQTLDIYDEYVPVGVTGSKTWEKIGDTQLNLADVVTAVSLSKQTDTAIGTDSTFTVTQPTITLAEDATTGVTFVRDGTTKYMAASASGAAVTPTTTNIKATASGGSTSWNSKDTVTAVTGYANPSTDTFVKSVSAETGKNLVTTTVPNVTDAGSASTWSFAMGTGTGNTETLIISGANSTAPTLGTAKTVATGATSESGTGDAVVTGVTIGSSASAITALGTPTTDSVIGADATFTNTQPTVALATGATAGTGVISVATGIDSVTQPTISLSAESSTATGRAEFVQSVDKSKKMKGTASSGAVAWNNKDSVTVLTDSTDVTVTKGNA